MMEPEPDYLATFGKVYEKTSDLDPMGIEIKKQVDQLHTTITEGSGRRSLIVVAESGTGKSTLLHGLFRKLMSPRRTDKWIVLQTSTAELMSGTKYIGEWQTRVKELIRAASTERRVLIYFSDVQNLSGAGRTENNQNNIADAMAPAIESGRVTLVAECSPEEYRRGVEPHSSVNKLFQAFRFQPHGSEDTRKVLRGVMKNEQKSWTQEFADVELLLPEATLLCIEQFGDAYFPNESQPGASVRLLRSVIENRRREFIKLRPAKRGRTVKLCQPNVVETLEQYTGVPRALLSDSVKLDLKGVRKFFESRVIGQKEPVDAVIDVITLVKAGLTDPGKPLSVMLFAGPTGVGKTELAKALAEYLFGDKNRMIRCDMSEYKDFHSFEKLIGGRDEGVDSLISKVRQQPFSVVLFDEVEKAHPNIFDVLLQAFDDGRLSDGKGTTTNLTQTIIIMTTNLGGNLSEKSPVGFASSKQRPHLGDKTSAALEDFFRPEFLNRIDHILQFKALERGTIETLATRELGKALVRGGLTRRELRVDFEPSVINLLVKHGYNEKFGARPLRRAVEQRALMPVARLIVGLDEEYRGGLIVIRVNEDDEISAEVVADRTVKTAERIVKGVDIVDPVDGKKTTLKQAECQAELDRFLDWVAELSKIINSEKLTERKTELVELTNEVDFWDDTDKARSTLAEMYRLERLLGAVERLNQRGETYQKTLEAALAAGRKQNVENVVAEIKASCHYAGIVRFGLECRDEDDRRDAILHLRLVDSSAADDVVAKLGGAYLKWAERKNYDADIVHEVIEGKLVREAVILVSGPAAFGILNPEAGMHEFVYAKTAKSSRKTVIVSVRVLGVPPGKDRVVVTNRCKGRNAKALLGDRIRSEATVQLSRQNGSTEGQRSVSVISPLKPDHAGEAAGKWLNAEISAQMEARNGKAEFVRRYGLKPALSVKDLRDPKLKIKANDFWRGEIDPVLFIGIETIIKPVGD